MHISQAISMTVGDIERRVEELQIKADALPDGPQRQEIMKEAAQLRMYAEAKRWIESPGLQPGT